MRRTLTLCIVTLIASLVLIVAGCSGGSDGDGGGPDISGDLTAPQLLEKSAANAKAATSYRIAFDGEAAVGLAQGASVPGVGLSLDDPIPFSGEGPAQQPDRFSFDVSATVGGLPVQGNLTRVGDQLFLSALGRDFALDAPAAQVRRLDAFDALPTLAGWIAEPRRVGNEDLDGTSTVKVTGRVDPEAAVGDLSPLLSAFGGTATSPDELRRAARQLGTSLSDSEVTAWIGTADLLPRRIDVRLAIPDGARLSPQLKSLTFSTSVKFSEFGKDVTIAGPSGASPLKIDDLTGLLGG